MIEKQYRLGMGNASVPTNKRPKEERETHA